jgi:glycosyltransferase involved in cell wall biosynthesis
MEDEIKTAAERAKNIRWLGWLPIAEVPVYSKLADVIYCCISPQARQAQYVTPNKLFEAFAAGKALIAHRGVGEMSDILARFPAAILLDQVTPEALVNAFQQLQNRETLQQLQRAALEGKEQFHWGVAEERLTTIYRELLSPTFEVSSSIG